MFVLFLIAFILLVFLPFFVSVFCGFLEDLVIEFNDFINRKD